MSEDVGIDIDYEVMKADSHSSIILEAFRVKNRIALLGLRVSSISYKDGDILGTAAKINCRNNKQDFIELLPERPANKSEKRTLAMLLMSLGKICDLHPRNVDIFYKGKTQDSIITTKHKRGEGQEKFEKSLNNKKLMNQLGRRSRKGKKNLSQIENDLLNLTVNNRINRDVAMQYCESRGVSYDEIYHTFIELHFNQEISPKDLPTDLDLPDIPFAQHAEEVNAIIDDLWSSQRFEKYVFICTNERATDSPRGCCISKNSLELLTRLKRAARAEGLEDVRVNKAGCLDNCEDGPSCVIYPEGTWYTLPDDDEGLERILEHLRGGDVAEDFVIGD